MRLRFAAAICVLVGGVFAATTAVADESPAFPDLPGMRVASEAARGEVAPSADSKQSSAEPAAAPASVKSSSEVPDVTAIQHLPGTAQIPVIGTMNAKPTSSRRDADSMPRGLAALAALGTIVSVGAFLVFRDRVVGR